MKLFKKNSKYQSYKDIVGLTGIMGSGKSTALQYFQKLGHPTISADELSRQVLHKNYVHYYEIQQSLKKNFHAISMKENKVSFILPNGDINRTQLAKIVFQKKKRVKKLNKIIHPHIHKLFIEAKSKTVAKIPIIYEVPLLFEEKLQRYFLYTVLLYTPCHIVQKRLYLRTKNTTENISKRLKYQISTEKKKKLSDYIIDNSFSKKNLFQEVSKVSKKIIAKKNK